MNTNAYYLLGNCLIVGTAIIYHLLCVADNMNRDKPAKPTKCIVVGYFVVVMLSWLAQELVKLSFNKTEILDAPFMEGCFKITLSLDLDKND